MYRLAISHYTRGGTLIASVLPSAIAVKTKVNGQLKIFIIVNGPAYLFDICGKVCQGQLKFLSLKPRIVLANNAML